MIDTGRPVCCLLTTIAMKKNCKYYLNVVNTGCYWLVKKLVTGYCICIAVGSEGQLHPSSLFPPALFESRIEDGNKRRQTRENSELPAKWY